MGFVISDAKLNKLLCEAKVNKRHLLTTCCAQHSQRSVLLTVEGCYCFSIKMILSKYSSFSTFSFISLSMLHCFIKKKKKYVTLFFDN